MEKFITFGTKNINSSIFRDIVPFNTKPYGGLWLTKYTEINANEWLMFLEEHPSIFYYKFNGEASIVTLNDNANILYINNIEDFNNAYNKNANRRTPSLKCAVANDKFKVANESAKLDYPVSLITADEASMAGGVYNIANSNYYLYNGKYFWTLSPSNFFSNSSYASVWAVMPSGSLTPWSDVTSSFGVRPVINLRADIQIIRGDGSSLNPFVVS